MAKLTPTISFTSNSDSVSNNPGPGSIAVTASIADSLNVDLFEQKLITTSTTLNENTVGTNGPIDGSALAGGDGDSGLTPGVVGGFIFLKNNGTTTGDNIYIAIVTAGGSQTSAVPAAANTTALDEADHETLRTFTLLPGEFAWFPWDYTGDIHWEAAQNNPQLEYWRWDRST